MTDQTLGPAPLSTYSEPEAVIVDGSRQDGDKSGIQSFADGDTPSFSDLLDIVNPLQHIPLVNTLYQHLTGDREGAVDDLVGGILWGGPIGLGAAMVNLIVQESTGKSIADNALALVSDDDDDATTAMAANADKVPAGPAPLPAIQQPTPVNIMALQPVDGTVPTTMTIADKASESGSGAVSAGEFLVFGAGAAPQNESAPQIAALPLSAPATPKPLVPLTAKTPGPATRSVPQPSTAVSSQVAEPTVAQSAGQNVGQAGNFLVFGANQPATNALPDQSTPAGQPPVRQAAQPAATANATPTPLTPTNQNLIAQQTAAAQTQALNGSSGRSYQTPQRRSAFNTPSTLPMPTTGPAAVPGNTGAVRAASNDQTGSAWFAGAFNQAMDKYDRAQALQNPDSGSSAASSTLH